MSANIYWRPVSKTNKALNVPAPCSFLDKMRKAGFSLPCSISQNNIDILMGMAIGFGNQKDQPNPFREIIELLDKYEAIELWPEY